MRQNFSWQWLPVFNILQNTTSKLSPSIPLRSVYHQMELLIPKHTPVFQPQCHRSNQLFHLSYPPLHSISAWHNPTHHHHHACCLKDGTFPAALHLLFCLLTNGQNFKHHQTTNLLGPHQVVHTKVGNFEDGSQNFSSTHTHTLLPFSFNYNCMWFSQMDSDNTHSSLCFSIPSSSLTQWSVKWIQNKYVRLAKNYYQKLPLS